MIDRYTKAVLTIIAICLLVLVGQNFSKPAVAQMQGNGFYCSVDPASIAASMPPIGVVNNFTVSCTFH